MDAANSTFTWNLTKMNGRKHRIIVLNFIFISWEIKVHRERERENTPSASSFSKHPQQLGLCQAKAETFHVFHVAGESTLPEPLLVPLRRHCWCLAETLS